MALLNPKKSTKKKVSSGSTAYSQDQLVSLSPNVLKELDKASKGAYGSDLQQTAINRLGDNSITSSGGVLPKYASAGMTELSMRLNKGETLSDEQAKAIVFGNKSQATPDVYKSLYSKVYGPSAPQSTGARSTGARSSVPAGGGSDGSNFGSVGTGYNPGGTTYQYDSAGNRIIGKDSKGRNIITGGGVDRTAGVNGQMGGVFDPSYWVNREQNIRKDVERERQGQIDAINSRYEGQVRREEETGAQDLARQRSMNLRAGLGGSDFGAANKAEVRNRTSANVRDIQANQDIAVGQAIDQIETIANQRYQNEFTTANQSFQNQMAFAQFQQTQQENARTLVKELGTSGLDMATIKTKDPQLYQNILQSSGLGEVQAEYLMNAAKRAASKVDYQWQVVGNTVVGFGLDPMTGELKQVKQEIDVEIPKNYNVSFAPDGTMIMVPNQFDPNIPPDQQIKFAGNYAKPTAGIPGSTTPYANDLDAVIGTVLSTIPSKFGQQQFQAQLAKARNDSDRINIVAAQVLKAQPSEVRRDFANQAVGLAEVDKAIALLESGTQSGVLQAGAQYTFNLAGKDFDPKLTKLNSHLTAAIQPYRNSVTGAAWGTQEDGEYAQLFGSTKYSPPELLTRLYTLKELLKSKSATTLNAFANPMGYGTNQFSTGAYAPSSETGVLTSPDGMYEVNASDLTPEELQEARSNGWQ